MTTGRSPLHTYFVMKTPDGKTVNVHLGPADAVESVAKRLSRGEQVKVEAFRTKKTANRHYIARSLTIGDRTMELRDKTLRPTWAGPGVLKERPGKIAVTAVEASLDAAVDPRFGRCAYFLIVDAQQGTFEAFKNPYAAAGRRAGAQSARMIASKGAKLVLTGKCGASASSALSAAGIQAVPGCSGIVRDAIKQYKEGKLQPTGDPNTAPRSGAGPRSSTPRGPRGSSRP
jgi:predicted Fe-Mo cluster-binding NifX family protein